MYILDVDISRRMTEAGRVMASNPSTGGGGRVFQETGEGKTCAEAAGGGINEKLQASKLQAPEKLQTSNRQNGGRRDACATFVEAGAGQSLGNQCPSSFVKPCQTLQFKKKIILANGFQPSQ